MKLHSTDHTVERSGKEADTAYTFRTTAEAFFIMSSGLYSDKIAAPIRELCCNAYDAHVAAGNSDQPFEVTLPNTLNPTFSVRDYGTGLSDEDVRQLYTQYFNSTKTDTDEQIGALGLGSKSPFAYTSSFSIESRFNGHRSMFASFINEAGVPTMTSLMESVPCDEPNGMTISFPVKTDDIDKFFDRARRALMYFPVPPVVQGRHGFKPYELRHTVEGTNWKIRDADYYAYMTGPYVIQGSVAYPLDINILDGAGLSDAALAVASTNLDLFVAIGEVRMAPSREALSYDPTTIANLIGHLENAASEMQSSLQQTIDGCPNMWAARKMINQLSSNDKMSGVFKPLHKQQPFTYSGLPIDTTIAVDLTGLPTVAVEVLQQSQAYGRRGRNTKLHAELTRASAETIPTISVIQQPHTVTVVDHMGKGFVTSIKEYAKGAHNKTGRLQHYVIIRPVDHKVGISADDMDAVLAQLGGPDVVSTTAMDLAGAAAAVKAAGYIPRKKGEVLRFTGFSSTNGYKRRKFSRLTWERENIDLDQGGYYVNIERFDVIDPNVRVHMLDDIIANAHSLGFIDDKVVYGLNEKDMKAIKGNDEWIPLFAHVRSQLTTYMADSSWVHGGARNVYVNATYSVSRFLTPWKTISGQVKDGMFKEFFDDLAKVPPLDQAVNLNMADILAGIFGMDGSDSLTTKHVQVYRTRLAIIREQYGMLQLVDLGSIDSSNSHRLIEYINTCEDAFAYAEEHKAA